MKMSSSSRSGSVRLRSALGNNNTHKGDPSSVVTSALEGSAYSSPEVVLSTKTSGRGGNRRTIVNNGGHLNHNSNSSGGSSNSNNDPLTNTGTNGPSVAPSFGLVNGTTSSSSSNNSNNGNHLNSSSSSLASNQTNTMTSTRSQSSRTSNSSTTKSLPSSSSTLSSSSTAMEVDEDELLNSRSCSPKQTRPVEKGSSDLSINEKIKQNDRSGLTGAAANPPAVRNPVSDNSSTNKSSSPNTSFPSNLLEAAMEVDPQEDSSSTSSSSESSDSSDSEDSSEMDEETCERKKVECQEDIQDLEKQFIYLRELLYKERLSSVDTKLEEVRSGRSKEYLGPLEKLQENMGVRIEITSKLREYRLQNLRNKMESEELAAMQNYNNQKSLLYDSIKSDLEDKIRRLEEDRNNDFTSELWLETALRRKNKKSLDIFGEKKKKPVVVSGPYIVYMLNDVDVVEDWTVIKKALAAPKRKYVEPLVF